MKDRIKSAIKAVADAVKRVVRPMFGGGGNR